VLDLPDDEVHVWLARAEVGGGAHGALREVLARYLDRPPQALPFVRAGEGKPALAREGAVRFNLSHSGGLVAVAVAREREVGVDVERRRPVHSEAGVARRIMSDVEHSQYEALPKAERVDFLLWVWARKEALVKAAGTGIRSSLQAVACEPGPGGRFAVLDLAVPGYAAAVAAEGHDWQLVVLEPGSAG
jgi:4'-phosphopantetheinyl transferase